MFLELSTPVALHKHYLCSLLNNLEVIKQWRHFAAYNFSYPFLGSPLALLGFDMHKRTYENRILLQAYNSDWYISSIKVLFVLDV